ncbi:MAG: hypothetical protein ACPG77_18315, partial [Nannocystaceae bacterium]
MSTKQHLARGFSGRASLARFVRGLSGLKLRRVRVLALAGVLIGAHASAAEPAAAEPAPAPAPAAAEPAPAAAQPAPVDNSARATEVYGERLDNLQSEVNTLKEQIFRSKARLSVLREAVRGAMEGSRVVLAHRNVMGTGFRLVKVVYKLDGAPVFVRDDDTGALDEIDEFIVYDGNLGAGPHAASVELTYRGHGYGVFNYLREYNFNSRSSHGFSVPTRGSVKLVSVGFESGNLTTEMQDRPAVDWQAQVLDAAGNPIKPGKSNKRDRVKKAGDTGKTGAKPGAKPKPEAINAPIKAKEARKRFLVLLWSAIVPKIGASTT